MYNVQSPIINYQLSTINSLITIHYSQFTNDKKDPYPSSAVI